MFKTLLASFAFAVVALPLHAEPPKITWTKQVIDPKFRSEGVAVADVNKDGKLDIITGELWYEGPDFKKVHEMQKPGDYGDGMKGYSHSFCVFMEDLNGDGYPDCIVIDFPGTPCYWLENPKGKDEHWKKHIIWHSACNETPLYKDLLGTGKRVLIMGFQPKGAKEDGNIGQMAYFSPKPGDPNAEWEMHPISEPGTPEHPIAGTMRYSHGLGVGDMNDDGKLDVIASGTNNQRHRRLVGATESSRWQDALEVPPHRELRRRLRRHLRRRSQRYLARWICLRPPPTTSASGTSSSGPMQLSSRPISTRTSSPKRTRPTMWTSTATA